MYIYTHIHIYIYIYIHLRLCELQSLQKPGLKLERPPDTAHGPHGPSPHRPMASFLSNFTTKRGSGNRGVDLHIMELPGLQKGKIEDLQIEDGHLARTSG